jgi:hypothetical protein
MENNMEINLMSREEIEQIIEDAFKKNISEGLEECMTPKEKRFWKMGYKAGFFEQELISISKKPRTPRK